MVSGAAGGITCLPTGICRLLHTSDCPLVHDAYDETVKAVGTAGRCEIATVSGSQLYVCMYMCRGAQYRVKLDAANTTTAVASVCRFVATTEQDCSDGVDDDCDGLVDKADPDCR